MNSEPSAPEPDWDRQLAAAVAADSMPTTPAGLALRVRHRLRRRRLFVRAAAGMSVAAVLIVGVLAWQFRPQPEQFAHDMPEPVVMRSGPPVDKLDVLARQQAAYLAVLNEMEKEF